MGRTLQEFKKNEKIKTKIEKPRRVPVGSQIHQIVLFEMTKKSGILKRIRK